MAIKTNMAMPGHLKKTSLKLVFFYDRMHGEGGNA
jgi:hypothetical protein